MFVALAVALGFLHFTYPLRWIFGPWGLLVQLGLANAVLALAAVVVATRRGWSVFRFNRLSWQSIAVCAAGGAVGGILLASLLSLLSSATGLPLHDVNEELIGVNDLPPIGLAIFAIIAVGSVLLGWHYAVDAYAGVLLVTPIWLACGAVARRLTDRELS